MNFQIKIKDLNGKENIQSIRYETETLWYNATGDCGCTEGQTCFYSSPTFYMTHLTSNDSIITYGAINEYIKALEPVDKAFVFGIAPRPSDPSKPLVGPKNEMEINGKNHNDIAYDLYKKFRDIKRFL